MADFIEVVGCDAGSNFTANDIQYFARESADFPHGFLAGFIQDGDFVAAKELVLRVAILVPRRLGDVVWDWPSWGQRVDGS